MVNREGYKLLGTLATKTIEVVENVADLGESMKIFKLIFLLVFCGFNLSAHSSEVKSYSELQAQLKSHSPAEFVSAGVTLRFSFLNGRAHLSIHHADQSINLSNVPVELDFSSGTSVTGYFTASIEGDFSFNENGLGFYLEGMSKNGSDFSWNTSWGESNQRVTGQPSSSQIVPPISSMSSPLKERSRRYVDYEKFYTTIPPWDIAPVQQLLFEEGGLSVEERGRLYDVLSEPDQIPEYLFHWTHDVWLNHWEKNSDGTARVKQAVGAAKGITIPNSMRGLHNRRNGLWAYSSVIGYRASDPEFKLDSSSSNSRETYGNMLMKIKLKKNLRVLRVQRSSEAKSKYKYGSPEYFKVRNEFQARAIEAGYDMFYIVDSKEWIVFDSAIESLSADPRDFAGELRFIIDAIENRRNIQIPNKGFPFSYNFNQYTNEGLEVFRNNIDWVNEEIAKYGDHVFWSGRLAGDNDYLKGFGLRMGRYKGVLDHLDTLSKSEADKFVLNTFYMMETPLRMETDRCLNGVMGR